MTVGCPRCSVAARNAKYSLRRSWPPRAARRSRFAHLLDDRAKLGRAAEEVLEVVAAVLGAERLVFAVGRVGERAKQAVRACRARRAVPVASPQHLDHVPAGAAEERLELLDDLAVAAHRSVEALQVAVDDEREVVEVLARGERERADDSGSSISPSPNTPHTRRCDGVRDAAMREVAHEARLVDRADRAEPIEPVGSCQKSGISHGCGYDDRPRPPTSWR
jgi:hypothetical protein